MYISRGENVAVSAPTSFGKSLLIEEVVARFKHKNILIIQPTLALIDETRRKLMKYRGSYNIIVNTKQQLKENNIFILTAERVLEFPLLPKIDFFIVDEFYKVSNRRNDSRIDALNVAIMAIMEKNPQSLFLTPTVDSLSLRFRERYNIRFFKTDYALVNTQVHEIRNRKGNPYSSGAKKRQLFKLLERLDSSSIVYVKSPNEAYKLAEEYLDYLGDSQIVNHDLEIFEWIDQHISKDWILKRMLKYGIGAHNGALPRHIVTSEIEMFNSGILKTMFATVSLIEGVNTVAKNIILYSEYKGNLQIDFFDYANISGRAGRLGEHYIGNVYLFNDELTEEHFTIDVPYIDQDQVSDEILFSLTNDLVINKERVRNLNEGIPEDLKKIIQKNLIAIEGQKLLYEYIDSNYNNLDYLRWRHIPTYDQLWKTLNLAYKYLRNNKSERYAMKVAAMSLDLVNGSLKKLINKQIKHIKKKNPLNEAINVSLRFVRNDANYRIPKLLSVVQSLQDYVFRKHQIDGAGEYSYFCARLENENVSERLRFLIDFGVPASAIRQIDKALPRGLSGDTIVTEYIKRNLSSLKELLIAYEIKLLERAL